MLNLTGLLWASLIYLCDFPSLGLFAWKYRIGYIKLKSELKFNSLKKKGRLERLLSLRKKLFNKLDEIGDSDLKQAI